LIGTDNIGTDNIGTDNIGLIPGWGHNDGKGRQKALVSDRLDQGFPWFGSLMAAQFSDWDLVHHSSSI
jgi:hypothetical protein